ncbi:MAG: VanW family protein [Candidatus Levybacteria bacterium]|nr:VanW family protein [Candidatus Levybacteria bacterium]
MNNLISLLFLPIIGFIQPALPANTPDTKQLAKREFSLEKRYADSFVNGVFKDNILLVLRYTAQEKIDPRNIDWKKVNDPFKYSLTLKPGEVFAYHSDIAPQYLGKVVKTTNANFNWAQGFKSSGWLVGDGVCHLASLIYWTAKDANLDAVSKVRHDFAEIPQVPREFGVSIYDHPDRNASDQAQNLYITNNKKKDVTFVFDYDGKDLKVTVEETI